MTRLLAHAAVAVALYVASDALGRLGDRVAARSARGARWPWARETSTSEEVDTDTRDDDAPTVSAYPLRPEWFDVEPDTDGLDCDGEDCDRADVDALGWRRLWFEDAGPDCADGLEKPPCCSTCGSELHKTDDCDDVPF